MQAAQSAMAVRRQRNRFHPSNARGGHSSRYSQDSLTSTRSSLVSTDGKVYFNEKREAKTIFGQVTMFHVGIVFIIIGLMLVLTAIMPGENENRNTHMERNKDILGTGSVCIFIGCLLTTVSRFITNNEERELNEYIQNRLHRPKNTGHHTSHHTVRESESNDSSIHHIRDRNHSESRSHRSHENILAASSPKTTPVKHQHEMHISENPMNSFDQYSEVPPLIPHKDPKTTATLVSVTITKATAEEETNSIVTNESLLSKIVEEEEIECEFPPTTKDEDKKKVNSHSQQKHDNKK